MSENPIFDNFELESEALDSIRVESQSISPQDQGQIERLIIRLHSKFIETMFPFLAWDIDPQLMAKKFITTNPEMFDEFIGNWIDTRGRVVQSYFDSQGDARAFQDEGNFVAGLQADLWRYLPEEQWDTLLKEKGVSEKELAAQLRELQQSHIILHEMTHLYQMNSELTPLWLMECQAYWMVRGIMQTEMSEAVAGFFQFILDKYGDEVHMLCFGKSTNQTLAAKLLGEFTPEIQKTIFPEYRETRIDRD